MTMTTTTATQPTVLQVLDNLNGHSLSVDAAISNAQKAYERKTWMSEAIVNNRLTDLFNTLRDAINELPEGTVPVKTFSANTGKPGTKKVNRRDIAKRSFTTAFSSASRDLAKSDKLPELCRGKKLSWKLCNAFLENITQTDVTTRVERLLRNDKAIDETGMQAVIALLDKEIKASTKRKADKEQREAAQERKLAILADIQYFMGRNGNNVEEAHKMAAQLHKISATQLKQAIG